MHVRTNLYSGETIANSVQDQVNQCLQTMLGLAQTVNKLVGSSLTSPEALKQVVQKSSGTSA